MAKRASKNNENFNKIISILKELHSKKPTLSIARHISDATSEYKDIWGIEDKELSYALGKYKEELIANVVSESEVDKIISDAKDLDSILDIPDDNQEEFYNPEDKWF